MSHIRSVPSIDARNSASHAIGLGQVNPGYLAREGSPTALARKNSFCLYFYTITWHALNTSMNRPRAGSNLCRIQTVTLRRSGEYFNQYLQGDWQPKTDGVRTLFAASGVRYRRARCGAQLREDVMRYGIYNQNLQAVPPAVLSPTSTMPRQAFTQIVSKIEIRKEGKTGRVYYPAPFMTNENLALYQDAYEIGHKNH